MVGCCKKNDDCGVVMVVPDGRFFVVVFVMEHHYIRLSYFGCKQTLIYL